MTLGSARHDTCIETATWSLRFDMLSLFVSFRPVDINMFHITLCPSALIESLRAHLL
jgi:hypothetical protein